VANSEVRQAQSSDCDEIATMCELLWPETPMAEHREEIAMVVTSGIDDERSQRAHEALGFEVVDRCVHFRKRV
jgi:hypothetical protein